MRISQAQLQAASFAAGLPRLGHGPISPIPLHDEEWSAYTALPAAPSVTATKATNRADKTFLKSEGISTSKQGLSGTHRHSHSTHPVERTNKGEIVGRSWPRCGTMLS